MLASYFLLGVLRWRQKRNKSIAYLAMRNSRPWPIDLQIAVALLFSQTENNQLMTDRLSISEAWVSKAAACEMPPRTSTIIVPTTRLEIRQT